MKLLKPLIEALLGFTLWTAFLTPYMLFVMRVDMGQYVAWLVMQAVLVPPIAIVVIRATNRVTGWLPK